MLTWVSCGRRNKKKRVKVLDSKLDNKKIDRSKKKREEVRQKDEKEEIDVDKEIEF